MKIHGYFWDPSKLKDLLKSFIDGQFLISTRYGETLRGKVSEIQVSNNQNRRSFRVVLKWVCRKKEVTDFSNGFQSTKTTWLKVAEEYVMDVDYLFYYFQDDEDRVKVRTSMGEVCRFYKVDDHTSLIKTEGSFVPFCIHKSKELKMAMYLLLTREDITLWKMIPNWK